MKNIKQNIERFRHALNGDCVILYIKDDTLIVDAGNKSAKEIKEIANVFFKHAYQIPVK